MAVTEHLHAMRPEGFGGLLIYLLFYWLMGNNYWRISLSNSIVPAGTHSGDFLYMGFEIAFHGAHISRSFPVTQVIVVDGCGSSKTKAQLYTQIIL